MWIELLTKPNGVTRVESVLVLASDIHKVYQDVQSGRAALFLPGSGPNAGLVLTQTWETRAAVLARMGQLTPGFGTVLASPEDVAAAYAAAGLPQEG